MKAIGIKQPVTKKREEIPPLGGIDDNEIDRIKIKILRICINCSFFSIHFRRSSQGINTSGDPTG